ncbi:MULTISPECIES: hypothetical protein [unclassified Streptomyces]|uniref:hypothetical protein n=1 Tax=unclassified Streptomyces TaxID=2593676 RepID=UPI0032436968
MADDGDGPRWTQVSRVGPWDAASAYVSAAVMCLCGPVMLASTVLAHADLMVMGIVSDWDDGEDVGVTAGLRVSGPGFREFEATWKRSHHVTLRVGLRLTAVVDPSSGRFRVEI